MNFVLDPDVQAVAEFMQRNFSATRLVPIANGIAKLSPVIWGQFSQEELVLARLVPPPPVTDDAVQTRAISSELHLDSVHVGDDSAAGTV